MRYEVELTAVQAAAVHNGYGADPRFGDKYRSEAWMALTAVVRANPPTPSKPLRMDEPGWAWQVIAHTNENDRRREFVRWHVVHSACWADADGHTYMWDALIDPEPYKDQS